MFLFKQLAILRENPRFAHEKQPHTVPGKVSQASSLPQGHKVRGCWPGHSHNMTLENAHFPIGNTSSNIFCMQLESILSLKDEGKRPL